MLHSLLILAAISAVPAKASPTPEATQTFENWITGCDNLGFCSAMSLERRGGASRSVPLHIFRGPGPNKSPNLVIDVSMLDSAQLAIGGQLLPFRAPNSKGRIQYCGEEAVKLIRKLMEASSIAVRSQGRTGKGSENVDRIPLAGLKSALLYMDRRQGSIATATALVGVGTKKAPAKAPGHSFAIERPPATKKPPRTISSMALHDIYDGRGCSPKEISMALPPITARLDKHSSLYVAYWPCGNGAYNFFADALIVDEQGEARPAKFDIGPGMTGQEIGNIIVNAEWIEPLRTLQSLELGRGMGDCGRRRNFVWDGEIFRLSRQEEMNECRGAMGFIATFNASVFDWRD